MGRRLAAALMLGAVLLGGRPVTGAEGAADAAWAIRNGAMTEGGAQPEAWQLTGTGELGRDPATFKAGPAALCVSVSAGKKATAYQDHPIPASRQLRVSGWVRSEGQVKVNAAVQTFDAKLTKNEFKQLKYIQNATDWIPFESLLTLPEWVASFRVLLLVEGEGRAWLDEVEVFDQPRAPRPLPQPGEPVPFEPVPPGKPDEPAWGYWPKAPKAWPPRHQEFLKRTAQGGIDIVFYGDSITDGFDNPGAGRAVWDQYYAPLKAVDYGIGGDTTRQLLYRIAHGELDGVSPRLIVLMIGTNNLYNDNNGGTEAEIAQGVGAVVKLLKAKAPQAKILLLGVLPRQNEFFCGRIKKLNELIKAEDDGRTVRFLDMGPAFEKNFGQVKPELFIADQLHLNEAGYRVWAQTMQPLFDELRGGGQP